MRKDLIDSHGYNFYRISCATHEEVVQDGAGRDQYTLRVWVIFQGYPYEHLINARVYAEALSRGGQFRDMRISVVGTDIDKYDGDFILPFQQDRPMNLACGETATAVWPGDDFQWHVVDVDFLKRMKVLRLQHTQKSEFNVCP